MKSKKRTIWILIVVIVLLLGIASAIFFINKYNDSKNMEEDTSNNIYNEKVDTSMHNEKVDSAIDSVLFAEDYNSLSLNEKKNRMLSILYQLEKDGEILKNSISYIESEKTIYFEYSDSFGCIIQLEKKSNAFYGTLGNADVDEYVKSYDYDGKKIDVPSETNVINFSNKSYPFPEKEIKKLNLTVKSMYGLCDLSHKDKKCGYCTTSVRINQNDWNNNHLKTDIDNYCTVEDFKTGLLGYNIVFIEEHGGIIEKFEKSDEASVIITRELFNNEKYLEDTNHLCRYATIEGTDFFAIKSSFFEKYYGNNKLKDTIVYISACYGYKNDNLVNAFEKCGAGAVIGYTDSVNVLYGCYLRDGLMYSLMYGDTVEEAIEFSKNVWKSDEKTWYLSLPNNIQEMISEYSKATIKVNDNGKNARLINLPYYGNISGKVTNENNEPVKGAEIGIHNVHGNSYGIIATTNENGEYSLECPQDSYKISVKADGYEIFETDDFIEIDYGKDTVFNITLKKVIETTEPIEPSFNYTAVDLIDKSIPEIIDMMNGEYQIIKTESDIYNYIQNQSVFPGMEFYIQVSGDDIISANNGEEIHSNKLEAKLESGELTLDGIQVNKSGKVSKTIQTDMDYKSCSKALGDFNCIGGTGGYLGGDVSSVSYDYNDNNAKVILNFNIPEEIYKDLSLGKISCVSSEQMKSYNPKLKNIVIRKSETNTGNNNS